MSERWQVSIWALLIASLCVFVIVKLWAFALVGAAVLGFAYCADGGRDK